jgi:hypothetical protein
MSNERSSDSGEPFGGVEEPTVPEASRGDVSNAVRGLGVALDSVLRECRETAFVCDIAEGHERIFRVRELQRKLGDLGPRIGEAESALGAIAAALEEKWRAATGG